ncbi:hypothetical protein K4749_19535 [Streptomyces sp. TRM72054]|uniref:hypothetical protein n=1 Tax=Streptomyces sp. TRM72054 TaxID=2870562 RepID=UPI001C8CF07C|nr:hypothetical protein [Streptomyces sp. TRM72054]MBX9395731.1 hypothetical protein [Streptomyces sp. TRM72054]
MNPGAVVSCTFHVGEETVQVHTLTTREPNGIALLASAVSALAAVTIEKLTSYVDKVAKPRPESSSSPTAAMSPPYL